MLDAQQRDDRLYYADILQYELLPLLEQKALLESIKNNNKQLQTERLQELLTETELRIAKADKYPKLPSVSSTTRTPNILPCSNTSKSIPK